MDRLQVTTLEGQDISAPLLAATYEATAGRELLVQVYLSGLAGGGTYRACLVKELIGGGAYQSPPAAAAVALGVSTVYLATTAVPVQAGDTVKVYVQGLAGDTAGVVVEVFDAAPDVAALALEATAQEILADTRTTLPAQVSGLNDVSALDVRTQVDAGLAAYAPAQAATALSNETWTDARAAKVDNLDAAVSSRSNLDAAGVRAAAGLAAANLDTQLGALPTDSDVQAAAAAALAAYAPAQAGDAMTLTEAYELVKTAAQAGDAMALTEAERTALDTKFGADGKTLAQAVAVLLAVIAGRFTRTENEDGSVTIVFRNLLDTVNRVTGKVDEEANRSAVTIIDGEGAD